VRAGRRYGIRARTPVPAGLPHVAEPRRFATAQPTLDERAEHLAANLVARERIPATFGLAVEHVLVNTDLEHSL
jgi:hypothetical protein